MTVRIINGDCLTELRKLPAESVHCVVTSPPYFGLRDYGNGEAGIGLEDTLQEHIAAIVAVFAEVWRVLRKDGTVWLNYGDCYAGSWGAQGHRETPASMSRNQINNHPKKASHTGATRDAGLKPKDLCMLPARIAIALQDAGWWVRHQAPWVKRSAMPESTQDRQTSAVEYMFLLTKADRYFYDREAVCKVSSPDTHARYARGRSDDHKFADGGPGGQTIARTFDHMRPKIAESGSGIKNNQSMDAALAVMPPTRNWRNSDLFFESIEPPYGLVSDGDGDPLAFDVNPKGYPGAHFATFPPALVEPCIKAGTSAYGVCGKCGAPWVRKTGDKLLTEGRGSGNKARKYGRDRGGNPDRPSGQGSSVPWSPSTIPTVGWWPSCACGVVFKTHPATVLDPFAGAGTTGLVAAKLGRDAILIEMNPEYCGMIERRLKAALLPTEGHSAEPDDHGPLFESLEA